MLMNDRTKHINYQNACRCLYHGWSSNLVKSATKFLCIIHDKIDHIKFAIPRMQRTTKATSGLGQIPISVTSMLSHSHSDSAYAHYSIAFWPGDSTFIISSICRRIYSFSLTILQRIIKNWYVMVFFLLLPARRIFKEVMVGFLIVGHTHEDIDAHFSYLSKLLKMKNTYFLVDLMKAFMNF